MITEVKPTRKDVLLSRVRNGNDYLYQLWQKAKAAAENQDEYSKIVAEIDKRLVLLNSLCQELISLGYRECLYTDKRECFSVDGWFCFVCTRQVGYGATV